MQLEMRQSVCTYCQGKVLSITLKILILVCLVILVRNYLYDPYEHIPRQCPSPKDVLLDIEKLMITSNHVLNNLNITHFLCYGSLWSALRRGQLMPWDYNGEFCLLNREVTEVGSKHIQKAFNAFGLHVSYLSRRGYYRVILPNRLGLVKLVLFSEMGDRSSAQVKLVRKGWLPETANSLPFPKQLIDKPLPLINFNGILLPAPHEGVEIQKYLYPYNWWLEVRPEECEGKHIPV